MKCGAFFSVVRNCSPLSSQYKTNSVGLQEVGLDGAQVVTEDGLHLMYSRLLRVPAIDALYVCGICCFLLSIQLWAANSCNMSVLENC